MSKPATHCPRYPRPFPWAFACEVAGNVLALLAIATFGALWPGF